jgi:hypothetical protein
MLSILLPFAVGFHPFFCLLDLRLFGLELARLPGRQGSALNPLVDPLNNPSPKRFRYLLKRCRIESRSWGERRSQRWRLFSSCRRSSGGSC